MQVAFAVLVDRLQEQLVHPVGFGKKAGDIVSWFKQMPIFIFGILSWMWGDKFLHAELRTGNTYIKGIQSSKS